MTVDTWRRLYRCWLPVALAVTAVANLVVDGFLPPTSRMLQAHDSGSLTHLVHTDQRTVDRRYGFYMELGDAMSGKTLVVPQNVDDVDLVLARGLSDVEVERGSYDLSDVPNRIVPDHEPLGLHQADDEEPLAYWILRSDDAERWWLGRIEEGLVVIPESLESVPRDGP